jgi:hypothetical protein
VCHIEGLGLICVSSIEWLGLIGVRDVYLSILIHIY